MALFIVGVLVGGLNSIPVLFDTTITDIAAYYDFWILCGILIIVNSKNNLGLKYKEEIDSIKLTELPITDRHSTGSIISKQNILEQVTQSILTQANQRPEGILQLLQSM